MPRNQLLTLEGTASRPHLHKAHSAVACYAQPLVVAEPVNSEVRPCKYFIGYYMHKALHITENGKRR